MTFSGAEAAGKREGWWRVGERRCSRPGEQGERRALPAGLRRGGVGVGGGLLGTGPPPPRSGFPVAERASAELGGGGGALARAELEPPVQWVFSGWGPRSVAVQACTEVLGPCPDGSGDKPFRTPPPRLRGLPRGGHCGLGGRGLGCGCLL